MFRDRIVGHYVGRGYRVDTDAVLEGTSGTKHKVDLVATDDLGRLAVWWGDREPFEGPELESVQRAARDLDAAPAIASPHPTAVLRDSARRYGVIVVDEATLDTESASMVSLRPPRPLQPTAVEQDVEYPPWPEPKKAAAQVEEVPAVQAPWRGRTESVQTTDVPTPDPDAPRRAFDWLPEDSTSTTPAPQSTAQAKAPDMMPAFWKPVLLTAVGLLVVILVLAFIL